jgi:hypothetical protein
MATGRLGLKLLHTSTKPPQPLRSNDGCKRVTDLTAPEHPGLFGKRVFLDSDDLRDLRKLQDHVRECDVFLLVQSASVLTRPYCLLELCVAIDAGKPIVGVSLSGAYAYDFAAAQALLLRSSP